MEGRDLALHTHETVGVSGPSRLRSGRDADVGAGDAQRLVGRHTLFFAFTSAPRLTSSRATSKRLCRHAWCRGVHPSCKSGKCGGQKGAGCASVWRSAGLTHLVPAGDRRSVAEEAHDLLHVAALRCAVQRRLRHRATPRSVLTPWMQGGEQCALQRPEGTRLGFRTPKPFPPQPARPAATAPGPAERTLPARAGARPSHLARGRAPPAPQDAGLRAAHTREKL